MSITPATQTDINSVLQQMRQLRTEAQVGIKTPSVTELDTSLTRTSDVNQSDFGAMVKDAIGQVNSLQKTSSATANDFLSGKSDDLVKVMVDSQKAGLGFQAVVQVRNRMVSAYQDIMNMPI